MFNDFSCTFHTGTEIVYLEIEPKNGENNSLKGKILDIEEALVELIETRSDNKNRDEYMRLNNYEMLVCGLDKQPTQIQVNYRL